MNTERRHFTAEGKVAILRQHLLEHVPVSELCERHGLQPSLFYLWQRTFFENGPAAFAGNGRQAKKAESLQQQKLERLQAKLQRKDEVLAELMEEHVKLKKVLGKFDRRLGAARHPRPDRRFHPGLVR